MTDFKTCVLVPELLTDAILQVSNEYYMTSTHIKSFDNITLIVRDKNKSYGLGFIADQNVFVTFDYPILYINTIDNVNMYKVTLPTFNGIIQKENMLIHGSFVYIPVYNMKHIAWIYDIEKKTQQLIELVTPLHATCFIKYSDGFYIYGSTDNKLIVKKITYHDLSLPNQ